MLIDIIKLKKLFDHNRKTSNKIINAKAIETAVIEIVMYIYVCRHFQKLSKTLLHVTETYWWRAEIEQSDYFFSALLGNGNDIYSTRKPKIIW